MPKLKIIRDPIHKDIKLNEEEISIVDTPEVQRLRNIKQTGLTCLVYPSANHSRFEHSIGTMHVAGEIAKNLENIDTELTKIVALLHDIGHSPFSHTLEVEGYSHEEFTREKIKKMDFTNYSPKEILEVYSSKGIEGSLIHGDVDADRMDYLVRDSHHTGVAYGTIDIPRLIRSIVIIEDSNKLGISEKGRNTVESLLTARYQMYPTVYMHPASRISETMIKNATLDAIHDKIFKLEDLSEMDDIDLISTLRNSEGTPKEIIKRIDKRKLFKNITTLRYSDLSPKERWTLINLSESSKHRLETEISEFYETRIFLDIPKPPKMVEHRITVLMDDKKYRLDEISPLAESLKNAYKKSWSMMIYLESETFNKMPELLKDGNKFLFKFIENTPIKNPILDVLNEHGTVQGVTKLSNLVKKSANDPEFHLELQKLIFCGLVTKKIEPVRGTFRYDYKSIYTES
ncbi:metal dependent phosphohydrolase [Methanococcus vannielii SB]|uniref:Metal dependent phosphohydrolase n=1 Tax=Methanococcus vannielii (strain ATCC 35089 / DSM 1224 / JCM 13029 / OCM 148 / SB) TaxID=406327 RepID=A6URF4_METVS|nr:HD domain-containing protein [Methanococcus vannielii]ABR55076.1 metal dependent phosphohydrolase [Methanococcus vannielii SB]